MPARCVASGMNTEKGSSLSAKACLSVKRTIGTTAASKGLLHVCTPAAAMGKLAEQSTAVTGTFSVRQKHISGKDRAAHELRCLCHMLEEAASFFHLNLGALACLEVAVRRLILMVGADKQGDAPSHVNAKCLTPLAETDEILAPGLRAPMSRRAREDWEVMRSAKKADVAAMTDSTTFDDDDVGNDGKQGGGSGKGQGKRGGGSRRVGAPPAEK